MADARRQIRATVRVCRGAEIVVNAEAPTLDEARQIAVRELTRLHDFEMSLLLGHAAALGNAEILKRPCPTCKAGPGEGCDRRAAALTAGEGDAHFHAERLP